MSKRVYVVGFNGRMGKLVCDLIGKSEDLVVKNGFDLKSVDGSSIHNTYPEIFDWIRNTDMPDVVIDFSKPAATMQVLKQAVDKHIPMVIAPTGFTDEQVKEIEKAAEIIPIFMSSNLSYGVNVVCQLLQEATALLPEYEISINEVHHSGKADAPSGTAKMFFSEISSARENTLTGSYGNTGKKKENELWISSERCGSFPGEHRVTFASKNDYIRIEHFAFNPIIFAEGALRAARFIMKQTKSRIYTMKDLINE